MMTTHNQTSKNMDQTALNEEMLARDIVKYIDEKPVSFAQAQQLQKARARALASVTGTSQSNGQTLTMVGQFSDYLNRHRAMSLLGLVSIILFALIIFQQQSAERALHNSDAFLLASELPPEAFADKGFDSWIEARAEY